MDALSLDVDHALAYGDDPWRHGEPSGSGRVRRPGRGRASCAGGIGRRRVARVALRPWRRGRLQCRTRADRRSTSAGSPSDAVPGRAPDVPDSRRQARPADVEAAQVGPATSTTPRPRSFSVTQSTECGTLDPGRRVPGGVRTMPMEPVTVDLDGAGLVNAVAALGCDVAPHDPRRGQRRELWWDEERDQYGEAVVFCDPARSRPRSSSASRPTQLPSKMRFVAAQFEALLTDDLWIRNLADANAMAPAPRCAPTPTSPAWSRWSAGRSTASSSRLAAPAIPRSLRSPSSGCGTRRSTRCGGRRCSTRPTPTSRRVAALTLDPSRPRRRLRSTRFGGVSPASTVTAPRTRRAPCACGWRRDAEPMWGNSTARGAASSRG